LADTFELRVSDSVVVPLRGQLLRMRVTRGSPKAADLAPGKKLRVRAPDGRDRLVQILAHSITGGRFTQQRLDKTREVDLIIPAEDAMLDGATIDIGWTVIGPE
jgi:hypothetical protein